MENRRAKNITLENYNLEDTIHSNHRRSESCIALEEEEEEFFLNPFFLLYFKLLTKANKIPL